MHPFFQFYNSKFSNKHDKGRSLNQNFTVVIQNKFNSLRIKQKQKQNP